MKQKWFRYLTVVLCIGWICFIFSNSFETGDESSQRSLAVLTWVQDVLFQGKGGGVTEFLIRKAAHFGEFAVEGILLALCIWVHRRRTWQYFPHMAAAGLLIALTDETIQLSSAGRSGLVTDVWIDFVGFCVGALLMALCLRRRGTQH